ncbi:hypothetical protein C8J57DRAFT_1482692 [Mycena rebaudengoi]|nr:hypothetical protein C8J57DRAFT_1482692 [Mycena rebaudengoi]
MQEKKKEIYDLDESNKFPDISNTRYGCYTYGAAEVVCFHGLIYELVLEIIDGKTKSGQPNHVEHLILKGLNCAVTMAELVALALYGASVSWPYMAMVRGTAEEPVNLLSLTDLHRKLPVFCAHIASNPHIFLDPTTPWTELSINGQPFANQLLLPAICMLFPDLPNPLLIISTMFSGCDKGWIQFTPEFRVGGTFDSLTPEQRTLLFIPSTNDRNEGMLGSHTVHMHYHPNSTTYSFANQARTERNNTEAFIKKACDASVQKYVMREVRKDGASGMRAKFRKAWVELQRKKAESARKRRDDTAAKKKAKDLRLAATPLVLDLETINVLSSAKLKEQLHIYKDVLKDEVLAQIRWKDMSTVAVRRQRVGEARDRELGRRVREYSIVETSNEESEPVIIDEFGFSRGDEAEWEDIDP